jgi:hypothetical protein
MRFTPGLFWAGSSAALTAAVIWLASAQLQPRVQEQESWLEHSLAESVIKGRDILFPSQVDEAMLRWSIAERLEHPPQVALLASSHGLQISSSYTAPLSVMNFSISGGGFPDHMVTAEILRQRGKWPKVWAVFVDPWFFNAELDFLMWRPKSHVLTAAEDHLETLSGAGFPRTFRDRVISVAQPKLRSVLTIEPILAAADQFIGKQMSQVVESSPTDGLGTVLLADGSIQPIGGGRDLSPEEVRDLAIRQFSQNRDRHRYGTFGRVDESLWTIFAAWVKLLRNDQARVVFVLSPYHPAIYDRIIADPKNHLVEVEKRVRAFAEEGNIPVLGSYNPTTAAVGADQFLDGDHLTESGLRRVIGSTFQTLAGELGVASTKPAP